MLALLLRFKEVQLLMINQKSVQDCSGKKKKRYGRKASMMDLNSKSLTTPGVWVWVSRSAQPFAAGNPAACPAAEPPWLRGASEAAAPFLIPHSGIKTHY